MLPPQFWEVLSVDYKSLSKGFFASLKDHPQSDQIFLWNKMCKSLKMRLKFHFVVLLFGSSNFHLHNVLMTQDSKFPLKMWKSLVTLIQLHFNSNELRYTHRLFLRDGTISLHFTIWKSLSRCAKHNKNIVI